MTPPLPSLASRLTPLLLLLAAGACAPTELRDDNPGRAQAFPPVYNHTVIPGVGERRTWSQIQAEQSRADSNPTATAQSRQPDDRQIRRDQDGTDQPPPKRRRGSSSPPPDPAALPQPPRPIPVPPPPSSQSATDAFKRDLIRPEVDRMRTDDAMGRLDPLGQRDLMRRENDLRQWGDPLAR
ncbi:hypothetical protein TSH100_20375 [Azospirillum sp. TSH100]|uniref:hypothetical protein n=1 Tax=Azospirillum sp. TSH100 TaxID=652764 RepID=UPI000D619616|nr:hypothetical protein [Azospirillum sp. TSH100]PWC83381.1 hypothetical protein TSH100_20375 [Azospirillum sp. TSH100]QCG87361.1 hypothetical protein E6C72_06255 [Azospirillum sp. TSH100]